MRVIFILLVVCIITEAKACICYDIPFYYSYNNSDLIFEGEVVSITPSFKIPEAGVRVVSQRTIGFRMYRYYKGEEHSDTVFITTGWDGGNCGLKVELNQMWLIFSDNGHTDICAPNFLLSIAVNDLTINQHPQELYDFNEVQLLLERRKHRRKIDVSEYGKNNAQTAKGSLQRGLPTGTWEYVLTLGEEKLKTITQYKNGLRHGVEEEFFTNGKIRCRRYYDMGKETGNWEIFSENGELIRTEVKTPVKQ